MDDKHKVIITVSLFSLFLIVFSNFVVIENSSVSGYIPFMDSSSISRGMENLFAPFEGLINGFVNVVVRFVGQGNSQTFIILVLLYIIFEMALSTELIKKTVFSNDEKKHKKYSVLLAIVLALLTFIPLRNQINAFILLYTTALGLLMNFFVYGFTFYSSYNVYKGKAIISSEDAEADSDFGKSQGIFYGTATKYFIMMLVVFIGYSLIGFVDRLFIPNSSALLFINPSILAFLPLLDVVMMFILIFSFVGLILNLTEMFSSLNFKHMHKNPYKRREALANLKLTEEEQHDDRAKKRFNLTQEASKANIARQKELEELEHQLTLDRNRRQTELSNIAAQHNTTVQEAMQPVQAPAGATQDQQQLIAQLNQLQQEVQNLIARSDQNEQRTVNFLNEFTEQLFNPQIERVDELERNIQDIVARQNVTTEALGHTDQQIQALRTEQQQVLQNLNQVIGDTVIDKLKPIKMQMANDKNELLAKFDELLNKKEQVFKATPSSQASANPSEPKILKISEDEQKLVTLTAMIGRIRAQLNSRGALNKLLKGDIALIKSLFDSWIIAYENHQKAIRELRANSIDLNQFKTRVRQIKGGLDTSVKFQVFEAHDGGPSNFEFFMSEYRSGHPETALKVNSLKGNKKNNLIDVKYDGVDINEIFDIITSCKANYAEYTYLANKELSN